MKMILNFVTLVLFNFLILPLFTPVIYTYIAIFLQHLDLELVKVIQGLRQQLPEGVVGVELGFPVLCHIQNL